jgi:hypothetical protein
VESTCVAAFDLVQPGSVALQADELGDSLGPLDGVVGAAKEILGGFAPTRCVLVEDDDSRIDRDASQSRSANAVPAGAGKLPTHSNHANVDGVDLAVALHRLTDRRRVDGVDRPQPFAEVDLVGIEGNDVAGISLVSRARCPKCHGWGGGRHV